MSAAAFPGRRLGILLELTKFPISAVSTLSAGTGYLAFRRGLDGWLNGGLATLAAGTLLMAMAASALNEVQECRVDALMERTRRRPIPRGALAAGTAAALAVVLGAGGFLLLRLAHGWTPALLGLLAMAWYNGLYTPLKRTSAFAVVPGSVIGALPPAMGWAAAGGGVLDPAALALCFLFFVWQVPHFWLLALLHRSGYQQAGLPTLHVHFTEGQILRLIFTWTCATAAACTLLPAFGTTRGWGAMGLLAGAGLWLVIRFRRLPGPGQGAPQWRRAFLDINVFLLLVMAAVVLDGLGLP
jgi:protoheme IX farnesyltransferase